MKKAKEKRVKHENTLFGRSKETRLSPGRAKYKTKKKKGGVNIDIRTGERKTLQKRRKKKRRLGRRVGRTTELRGGNSEDLSR